MGKKRRQPRGSEPPGAPRSTPNRKLTIVAQDPSVHAPDGSILRAQVEVPAEPTEAGPRGYRVHVVDFDVTTNTHYAPLDYLDAAGDPFANARDAELLANPHFHAQNVYAIVMRTLARFEYALGRRVGWSFPGHQLKIAPHAFADANAFYSEEDESLLFGYFMNRAGTERVFSCLSHDVVAHETTHAILDGLRTRYTSPSSPDQAAFHEGFADVVALLSVFSLKDVVNTLLSPEQGELVSKHQLSHASLRAGALFGLADQMGQEMQSVRGSALRRSVELEPSPAYMQAPQYEEPHRRGEILVAAVLNAFLAVWVKRISTLGEIRTGYVSRPRVVEEGAEIANHLLTIAIRALDYAPPVDLQFGDYLSALLTADLELYRDDGKYGFRDVVREWFTKYGVTPAADGDGTWKCAPTDVTYERSHFEPLQRDPDEVFRFVWENRGKGCLDLYPGAYARVMSVRPCMRQGPDGFFLRETVAEYIEILSLRARELRAIKLVPSKWTRLDGQSPRLQVPTGMSPEQEVTLYGGGALIFDEFGRLKYHVKNRIDSPSQQRRLDYLWSIGHFRRGSSAAQRFMGLHLRRASGSLQRMNEAWS